MEISLLFETCESGNKSLVKYIVEQGLNINRSNMYGNNTLMRTSKNGNEAMVMYLVEKEAKINIINKWGESPLFYAYSSGNESLVKYLIYYGKPRYLKPAEVEVK